MVMVVAARGSMRSAVNRGCGLSPFRGGYVGPGGIFIIGCGLLLHDLERARRADVEARSQPVAIDISDEDGFAFPVELKGAFGAGSRAKTAAITKRPVYLYELSLHELTLQTQRSLANLGS